MKSVLYGFLWAILALLLTLRQSQRPCRLGTFVLVCIVCRKLGKGDKLSTTGKLKGKTLYTNKVSVGKSPVTTQVIFKVKPTALSHCGYLKLHMATLRDKYWKDKEPLRGYNGCCVLCRYLCGIIRPESSVDVFLWSVNVKLLQQTTFLC